MAGIAPVAPVVVQAPVAPRTPDTPVFLLASDELVGATAFLAWQPAPPLAAGGAARVSLATHQMIKAFGTRFRISRLPADLAAASNVSVLTLGLDAAFWSRALTALRDGGINAIEAPASDGLTGGIVEVAVTLCLPRGERSFEPCFARPVQLHPSVHCCRCAMIGCSTKVTGLQGSSLPIW